MNINRRTFIGSLTAFAAAMGHLDLFAVELPSVPAYYDAHLAEVIAKVNRNRMERGCTAGFVFITDPHVKSNRRQSGRLIARLIGATGLTRVLCGGDLCEAFGEGYASDKAAVDYAIDAFRADWVKPVRAAGGRLYCAKGNHDFTVRHSMKPADGERGFTYPGSVAKRLIVDEWSERDLVTKADDPTACYYYVDDAVAKARYIVADTTDTETAGDIGWGVHYGVHDTQLRWLASEALGTVPRGYTVIVMQHCPVIDVAGTADDERRFPALRRLLADYQNRRVFREGDFTFDFSSAQGWLALNLSGHQHGETQTWSEGVLHVSEPCDAAYRDYDYRSAFCGKLPEKKAGTIYEQTFDIVQVDPLGHRVFFTRVGGGQDRVIHADATTVGPEGSVPLTPQVLTAPADWISYDGNTAIRKPNPENRWNPLWEYRHEFGSIDEKGRFTARTKPGVALVMARDAALNKEIFPVEVK